VEEPHFEDNTPPIPWSTSEESDALRRSSRLGSYAQKRQYNDLKGLTTPQKKKRKSVRNRNRDGTPTPASQAEEYPSGTTPETSRATPAPAAVGWVTVPPTTDTNKMSDSEQADGHRGEERLAQEGTNGPDTGDVVCEATTTIDAGAEAASIDEAPGEPTSSEAATPSSNEAISPRHLTPATDPSSLGSSPSTTPLRGPQIIAIGASSQPDMPSVLNADDALRIMPSVLLHCARQHYMIGKFGQMNMTMDGTTDPRNVRSYTNQIAAKPYEAAIKDIAQRNVFFTAESIQTTNNENIYWQIILKGAAQLDPAGLPTAKGPSDDFSKAEKVATYNFMDRAGLGTSASNQRQCRWFWKALFDFRERGVEMITCYRTPEFNKYCREYSRGRMPSLADTVVSWEAVYGPCVDLLERRVYEYRVGNFSGRLHLKVRSLAERLAVPESSWNDGGNKWFSQAEEMAFKLSETSRATSSQTLSGLFNDCSSTGDTANKSIFVTLKAVDGQPLLVYPMIPVSAGDFLGIFAGTIRFTEDDDLAQRIPGPTAGLFLDYSHVTGTLNQMQVSEDDSRANVRLEWQAVNEDDATGWCDSWRVKVVAARSIAPFDSLVRVATSREQFALHQSTHHAGRGFLG
jgi:hypothetical protein